MDDFEIIDVHTHLVKTDEEHKNRWAVPGRRACDRWGTPERAIPYMDRNGISKMVVLVVSGQWYKETIADRIRLRELPESERIVTEGRINQKIAPPMREYNQWICEMSQRFPRLVPYVCISKELGGAEGMVEEVALRASQGAKGVKLHPGILCFYPDDAEMWPVYHKCEQLGLPIIADSGPFGSSNILTVYPSAQLVQQMHQPKMFYGEPKDFGEPKNFAKVLEDFPKLTLVLAHLGSAWWDERVELAQKYANVYFDTSQGFTAPDRISLRPHRGLAEEDAVRIMRKIGVERIMFGSDAPPIPLEPQLEQILRLPLSDDEKRMILSENAKRILHI